MESIIKNQLSLKHILTSPFKNFAVIDSALEGVNAYLPASQKGNQKYVFRVNSDLSAPFTIISLCKNWRSPIILTKLLLLKNLKKSLKLKSETINIYDNDSGIKLIVKKFLLSLEPNVTEITPPKKLRDFVLTQSLESLNEFKFPKYLHIALLNKCNLKCIMCPYHSEELKRDSHTNEYFEHELNMPKSLMYKILDEAGKYGSSITFGQYEEAMLCKDIYDYIAYAKQKGCNVSLTTNGTLLKTHKAKKLLETGVDHISFSLDAASEESYTKIRGGNFKVPIKNLRHLVNERNDGNYKATIRACMVLQPGNEHERDAFQDLMNDIGVDMISYYNLSTFEDGVWMNKVLNFDIDEKMPERYACSQLWQQAMIYPDGNLSLCCASTMYVSYRDDIPYLGNISKSSIYDIWHSQRYNKIRQNALNGIFSDNSVCQDCQIWHNFMKKEKFDANGNKIHMNPYETFITFKR